MSHSESFESRAVPKQYEVNQPTETSTDLALGHWQACLLPMSCIEQEDNLGVLRTEIETAHELLQQQQVLIDSLTEQLTNRERHLQHTQDKLENFQQAQECHAASMVEVEAVCRDLKMQLRRQQQRVLQYRNLVNERALEPVPVALPPSLVEAAPEAMVKQESDGVTAVTTALSSKPPCVSTWSAPESIGLTGPLARYRKLATIRMTTSRLRIDAALNRSPFALPGLSAEVNSLPFQQQESEGTAIYRVELPSFTRSH
jgi:hypothetical protein